MSVDSNKFIITGLMKHNCTTCKWSNTDQIGDMYCCNDESKHCADFVSMEVVCKYWESNGDIKNGWR